MMANTPAPAPAAGKTSAAPPPASASNPFPGIVLLLALCALVFWRVVRNGFVNFDDNFYIYENPVVRGGLSLSSLKWAFTTRVLSNWHPLTWISHLADVSLFGLDPAGHHGVNLLLHGAVSVLLFLLLRTLTSSPGKALFAAALFAVHPLHVESVAWVSERKDLLCTLFWFLAVGAWLRYLRSPSAGRYLVVALLFALALMAKPMAVTFPVTLLLLDLWPLGRHRTVPPAHLVSEKMPLFALSIVSAIVTGWAQFQGGSISPLSEIPFLARLSNTAIAYTAYLGKTFLPLGLSVFYPHPGTGVPGALALLSCLALVAFTLLLVRLRHGRPWLLWGWSWYLLTLVPVIGLVQAGAQAMADRYTYVPLAGIFVAVAWEGEALVARLAGSPRRGRRASVAAASVVLALLAFLASERVKDWRNGETLFTAALAVDPANYLALNNLGNIHLGRGETAEALGLFLESLRLRPGHPVSNFNVGYCYLTLGRADDAIPYFRKALEVDPRNSDTHYNLGNAWAAKGEWGHAAESYRDALTANPGNVDACINLGNAVLEMGDLDGAAGWYREALSLSPRNPVATQNLLRAIRLKEQKPGKGTR